MEQLHFLAKDTQKLLNLRRLKQTKPADETETKKKEKNEKRADTLTCRTSSANTYKFSLEMYIVQ